MNLHFPAMLALATVLAVPAADAAQAPAPRSVTVAIGDLDLSNPAGQQMLRQRLSTAANAVCSANVSTGLAETLRRLDCRADTLRRAMNEIDPPVLIPGR